MAIELGSQSATFTTKERTASIIITSGLGAEPVISVSRAVVRQMDDGTVLSNDPAHGFSRSLSSIKDEVYQVGGNSYTAPEIAALLAHIADQWAMEEIKKREAAAKDARDRAVAAAEEAKKRAADLRVAADEMEKGAAAG
jgi:hypothetical protein